MDIQKLKAVTRLQLETSEAFLLIATINGQIHLSGNLSLDAVAIAFANQAKAYNIPLQELLAEFTRVAQEVYTTQAPDKAKILSIN